MKTSEIVDENESTMGPNLPWEFNGHCATKINSSHAIITGGKGYPHKTLIVQLDNFKMTDGPDMAGWGRWGHGCSQIIHPNGTNFIVVTGGLLGDNSDVSEILDVNDIERGWFSGKRDKFKYDFLNIII